MWVLLMAVGVTDVMDMKLRIGSLHFHTFYPLPVTKHVMDKPTVYQLCCLCISNVVVKLVAQLLIFAQESK